MKTIKIKGKDYVEVHERVTHLRENYENAQLLTEIISNENGVCVMKATLMLNDKIVSTGHAYEKEGSNNINNNSYIENCETSAVGRCLGNYGIGINSSIASADEVLSAINQQQPTQQKPQYKAEMPVNDVETNAIKIVMNQIHEYCANMTSDEKREALKKASSYTNPRTNETTSIDDINNLTINGNIPSVARLNITNKNLRKLK
jgi:hypothetical protein